MISIQNEVWQGFPGRASDGALEFGAIPRGGRRRLCVTEQESVQHHLPDRTPECDEHLAKLFSRRVDDQGLVERQVVHEEVGSRRQHRLRDRDELMRLGSRQPCTRRQELATHRRPHAPSAMRQLGNGTQRIAQHQDRAEIHVVERPEPPAEVVGHIDGACHGQ
ncbi:hypothetical protein [Lentzea xinjiangensis]|uniref:hypothetical protein n=1 Tax=Lentzea xinjiangensis TaxID=402600 RepID=UPI001160D662|nr:hypothetical protein [Lentzea xinjiangensis]